MLALPLLPRVATHFADLAGTHATEPLINCKVVRRQSRGLWFTLLSLLPTAAAAAPAARAAASNAEPGGSPISFLTAKPPIFS